VASAISTIPQVHAVVQAYTAANNSGLRFR